MLMPEIKDLQKKKDGDLKNIEELCSSTWEPLYRFIYFKVQNREEAEDIIQETYIKAIDYLQKNSNKIDKHIGFLKTVALNVLRDQWRKNKRQGIKVNFELIHPKEQALEDSTENTTQRMMLEAALNQLNEEQQTIIELRIIKGYSVAETAKMMNKKEATIRVTQYRALQTLSKILKEND